MKNGIAEKVNALPAEEARLLSGKDIMLHRILNVVYRRIEIAAKARKDEMELDLSDISERLSQRVAFDLIRNGYSVRKTGAKKWKVMW